MNTQRKRLRKMAIKCTVEGWICNCEFCKDTTHMRVLSKNKELIEAIKEEK